MYLSLEPVRYLLVILGCCLLVVAGILLLWCVLLFQQFLSGPEEVPLIQYILSQIDVQGAFVSGTVDGADFQVSLSGTAKTFGFILLGLLSLVILSGIVKALIFGGVEIIKGAMAMQAGVGVGTGEKARRDVHVHKVVR